MVDHLLVQPSCDVRATNSAAGKARWVRRVELPPKVVQRRLIAKQGPPQLRICVQVKSGDAALDLPMMNQLIGTMQNVQAEQGLLVSWGGFKSSVDKERAVQFFRVRLWDQSDLIEQLLANYEKIDEDIRTDIPLKRIWTIASPDDVSDT